MSLNNDILSTLSKNELIQEIKSSQEDKKSLQYLLNNLHGISWEFDLNADRFTYVSSAAKRILGYEADEWTDLASWVFMLHDDDKERVANYCAAETRDGNDHTIEYRMLKKNGDFIWVLDVVRLGKDEDGIATVLYGFILDITKQKEEQLALKQEHEFLQTVLNGISDPVMIINSDYSVNIMNNVVKKQLKGKKFIDPSSPKCYEISHHRGSPCEGINDPCPLKDVLESKKATKVLHNHRHDDGSDNFVELAASPLFDAAGNCTGIIESARNVTSHIMLSRELEAKTRALQYEATHDYLTGLPNRALFMDRLEQSIKDAHRHKSSLALFFMDLDHFKEINDTFGHHMGDAVLKTVCEKFQASTRANDVLSRLAGDEFTVILKDVREKRDIKMLAQKLIDIFKIPLVIDGHSLNLSVSIGISIYTNNTESADKLLQKADGAMYKAKEKGKNNFQFAS